MADPEQSGSDGSDASSGNESSQPATELMITTRERRKTAGNRYSQVVAQEQTDEDVDDDVALLFAEAEGEDEEYNSDEADDEADMSSSDDDDQGPDAGAEDLEGEQELQKQAKVDRQKKRKADMALTTMSAIRKKPKIDPTALHRAPDKPKPSKRKERISWLPDSDAAPGRTSLRKQTVARRETMLERLKESEDQRLKNKAQRERKERLKQAEAPKELTQEDRLAEAARNERRNAKSLNRWEAKEKERAAEQAAKLAALKDRKLSGAVLTLFSAAHVYQGLRNDRGSPGPSGVDEIRVRKKYQRRSKVPLSNTPQVALASTRETAQPGHVEDPVLTAGPTSIASQQSNSAQNGPEHTKNELDNTGWLAGIHEYASLPSAPSSQNPQMMSVQTSGASGVKMTEPEQGEQSESHDQQVKAEEDTGMSLKAHTAESESHANISHGSNLSQSDPSIQRTEVLAGSNLTSSMGQNLQAAVHDTPDSLSISTPQPDAPHDVSETPRPSGETQNSPPVIEVISTRNLVILDKFDEVDSEDRQQHSVFYNTKKGSKLVKTNTEYCAITGQVAKYRDPISGAGYGNMTAYKKIREAQKHQFVWSSMLGCYVGRVGHVARGVPDGFVGK